jgi:hypothetical protein
VRTSQRMKMGCSLVQAERPQPIFKGDWLSPKLERCRPLTRRFSKPLGCVHHCSSLFVYAADFSVLVISLFADVRHCSLALVSSLVSGNLRFTTSRLSVQCHPFASKNAMNRGMLRFPALA